MRQGAGSPSHPGPPEARVLGPASMEGPRQHSSGGQAGHPALDMAAEARKEVQAQAPAAEPQRHFCPFPKPQGHLSPELS